MVDIVTDENGNPIICDTDDDSIAGSQKPQIVVNLHYGWNGSNWERVATDGSGNLKVTL